ncbi:hypothetical protein KKA95_01680 [Patescibacteria group bacterium]|nr:hypothetical protein [Patescibacteria group bacterium]
MKAKKLSNFQALMVVLVVTLSTLVSHVSTYRTTSFGMISLEEHAKIGENGEPVSPEQQARRVAVAEEVVAEMKDPDSFITVDEAWPIFKRDGAGKLKDMNVEHVRFPLIADSFLGMLKFLAVASIYKKAGVDLSQETIVELPFRATDGQPVYLPKFFAEELMAASDEAGVPLQIAWGVRDTNLQAIMWARTLLRCQDDPPTYFCKKKPRSLCLWAQPSGCEKEIRREVGKPTKEGFTHLWSVDIINWYHPKLKKALANHKFIVGCNSNLTDDRRHATWNLTPTDSFLNRAGCEVGLFF